MGGISPDSLQDKGDASPENFYEDLSGTTAESA
jgi:hypothetical protein